MPGLLRILRETFILPIYQDFPPTIKAKINLIEELHGQAMLFQFEEICRPVPDFDEHARRRRQEANSFCPSSEEVTRWFCRDGASSPEEEPEEDAGFPYLDDVISMADPGYEPYSELFEPGSELLGSELLDPDSELLGPGSRLLDLAYMLMALWFYWIRHPDARSMLKSETKKKKIPARAADLEAALDLSLAKLALRVGIETASIRHWKKKKEPAVRLNLLQRMQTSNKVKDAFHQVRKKQGDTFNRIIQLIYNYLIKNGKTKLNKRGEISPGKKTIERALKANKPLMELYFKKEERGQKERIIYIGHTGV